MGYASVAIPGGGSRAAASCVVVPDFGLCGTEPGGAEPSAEEPSAEPGDAEPEAAEPEPREPETALDPNREVDLWHIGEQQRIALPAACWPALEATSTA